MFRVHSPGSQLIQPLAELNNKVATFFIILPAVANFCNGTVWTLLFYGLFLANYNTKQSRPRKTWDSPLRGVGAWGSWHQVEGCPGVCQRESAVYSVFAFPSLSGAFASYCTWTHIRLDPGTEWEQRDDEQWYWNNHVCSEELWESDDDMTLT